MAATAREEVAAEGLPRSATALLPQPLREVAVEEEPQAQTRVETAARAVQAVEGPEEVGPTVRALQPVTEERALLNLQPAREGRREAPTVRELLEELERLEVTAAPEEAVEAASSEEAVEANQVPL